MTKAILVFDGYETLKKHYGKEVLITINIPVTRKEIEGYQYHSTEHAILKPMPEKKPISRDRGKNHCEYSLLDRLEYQKGFNDCVNEILEEENNTMSEELEIVIQGGRDDISNHLKSIVNKEEYIKQLIRKNIPLPVYLEGDGYWDGELVFDTAICQNCNAEYEVDYEHYKYCPNCGQRLDWSEVEE